MWNLLLVRCNKRSINADIHNSQFVDEGVISAQASDNGGNEVSSSEIYSLAFLEIGNIELDIGDTSRKKVNHCHWGQMGGLVTNESMANYKNISGDFNASRLQALVIGSRLGNLFVVVGYSIRNILKNDLNRFSSSLNSPKLTLDKTINEGNSQDISDSIIIQYRINSQKSNIDIHNNNKGEKHHHSLKHSRNLRSFQRIQNVMCLGYETNHFIHNDPQSDKLIFIAARKIVFLPFPYHSIFIATIPIIFQQNMKERSYATLSKKTLNKAPLIQADNIESLPLVEISHPSEINKSEPTIVTAFDIYNIAGSNYRNYLKKKSISTLKSEISILSSVDNHGFLHLTTLFYWNNCNSFKTNTSSGYVEACNRPSSELKVHMVPELPIISHMNSPIHAHPFSRCSAVKILPSFQNHNSEKYQFSGVIATGNESSKQTPHQPLSLSKSNAQVKLWQFTCVTTNAEFPNMDIEVSCLQVFTIRSMLCLSVTCLAGLQLNNHLNGIYLCAGTSVGSLYCWGDKTKKHVFEESWGQIKKKDETENFNNMRSWTLIYSMDHCSDPITHLEAWNNKEILSISNQDLSETNILHKNNVGFLISGDSNGKLKFYRPVMVGSNKINSNNCVGGGSTPPIQLVAQLSLKGPCRCIFKSKSYDMKIFEEAYDLREIHSNLFLAVVSELGEIKVWHHHQLPHSTKPSPKLNMLSPEKKKTTDSKVLNMQSNEIENTITENVNCQEAKHNLQINSGNKKTIESSKSGIWSVLSSEHLNEFAPKTEITDCIQEDSLFNLPIYTVGFDQKAEKKNHFDKLSNRAKNMKQKYGHNVLDHTGLSPYYFGGNRGNLSLSDESCKAQYDNPITKQINKSRKYEVHVNKPCYSRPKCTPESLTQNIMTPEEILDELNDASFFFRVSQELALQRPGCCGDIDVTFCEQDHCNNCKKVNVQNSHQLSNARQSPLQSKADGVKKSIDNLEQKLVYAQKLVSLDAGTENIKTPLRAQVRCH